MRVITGTNKQGIRYELEAQGRVWMVSLNGSYYGYFLTRRLAKKFAKSAD